MRPFRLFDLPALQLKRVLLAMNHCQRIKLAVCSRIAEAKVKQMNIRIHSIFVFVVEKTRFVIKDDLDQPPSNDEKIYLNAESRLVRNRSIEKINGKILSSCYQKDGDKELHFVVSRNCVQLSPAGCLIWIADLFPQAQFGWHVFLGVIGKELLERLYQMPHFTNAHSLGLSGGMLSCAQFTELLNRMNRLQTLVIDSPVSPSFSNTKALSYNTMHYEYARWMKVEDMFLMKSPFYLSVVHTQFDNEDLNRYLRHWIGCKENLKGRIELRLKRGVQVDIRAITSGIRIHRKVSSFTIMCDPDLERDHQLAVVYLKADENKIIFVSVDKEKLPQTFQYLAIRRRARDLKNEIQVLSQQIEKYHLAAEDDQKSTDLLRECRELEATRGKMEEQLKEVKRQMNKM